MGAKSKDGLQLIQDKGIKNQVVELDSSVMVQHKDSSGNNITLCSVVDDCKALTQSKTSIASGKLRACLD